MAEPEFPYLVKSPCISYLSLHNKLPQQLETTFIASHSFRGAGTWEQLGCMTRLWVSYDAIVRLSVGLQTSEDLLPVSLVWLLVGGLSSSMELASLSE